MSEQRITQTPDSGRYDHPTAGLMQRQTNGRSSNLIHLPEPPTRTSFWLRSTGGAMAATIFVTLCWLLSDNVNGDIRILAGPILFLRTWGTEDHIIGIAAVLTLLLSIFAVCVWRNAATITLSIIACLCWLLIGFWIEAMASV
jgi:hypothetical protein